MIIIRIGGGLGNQMFQFALYRELEYLGKKVAIDDFHIKKYGNQHNGFELVDVFRCKYNEATLEDIYRLSDAQLTIFDRIKRKVLGNRKRTHYIEKQYNFHPEILQSDECYLEGYWQSYEYFQNIEKQITDVFQFEAFKDAQNRSISQRMAENNSVAIHIRRGDYMNAANRESLGDICTKEYYTRAMEYIEAEVINPQWFLFTDDIEWCKENFPQCYIVDWNTGKASYRDMQLMTLCKHNIIANSTFSWWGAWLNRNPNKIVIAPAKWKNNGDVPDICPKKWVKI